MNFTDFELDVNYKFADIEKQQRIYLAKESSLIIRLDGKNITKNHDGINLLTSNFTEKLHEISKYIIEKEELDCSIFSILDESSFAFEKGNDFFSRFDDSIQFYCSNIFLQWFLQEFWKIEEYKNVLFGISMFSLSSSNINEYIKERKRIGELASLTYFAKEKMQTKYYHNKSKFEIKKNLQHFELFDELLDYPNFLTGFSYNNSTKNNYVLI